MSSSASLLKSTSPSLLVGAVQRDPVATEHLYRIYYPLCVGWCRELGLQECDAFDTAQVVLLKVIERLGDYTQKKGRFRGWLWTVTKNAVTDCHRKRKWEQGVPEDLFERLQSPPHESTCSAVPRVVAARAFEVLKAELTERTFLIVKAIICDGRRPADVADELGISVGAVYTAQCRAMKQVRIALKDLEF